MNDNLAAWLRLTLIPGLGGESQRKLLKAFGLPQAIFEAGRSQLRSILPLPQADLVLDYDNGASVNEALAWSAEPNRWIITLGDSAYPPQLLQIPDPPNILYGHGNRDLLQDQGIGIVGSRNATPLGVKTAKQFAHTLASHGQTIVSGLALGIDAAAHDGALEASGTTIAVIGTGADRLYPARNKALAQAICERGCIVTEFPLGTPALAANFPRRNRIISGLCRGILVVEAAVESGSLITARLAAEQGREVFAIPGSIHSPVSRGCHLLIKQGAKLVETAQDILDELPTLSDAYTHAPAAPAEEHWLLSAMSHGPCSLDELLIRTKRPAAELLPLLLELEISGAIGTLPGNLYQRLV